MYEKTIKLDYSSGLRVRLWFYSDSRGGLTPQSWHLFAIFVATIVGFITQPLPIGGVSIVVITVAALTGTLKIGEAISGFANTAIWLIVGAFLFSRALLKLVGETYCVVI